MPRGRQSSIRLARKFSLNSFGAFDWRAVVFISLLLHLKGETMNANANQCDQQIGYRIRIGATESFEERISLNDPVVNGRQILQKSGRRPEKNFQLLMLTSDGGLEEIGLEELVDLRARGVEKFFVFETDCLRAFEIDDRRFLWGNDSIPEHTLRFLANVAADYSIWQEIRGKDDKLIEEGELASLADKGVKVFFTGKDQTNAG